MVFKGLFHATGLVLMNYMVSCAGFASDGQPNQDWLDMDPLATYWRPASSAAAPTLPKEVSSDWIEMDPLGTYYRTDGGAGYGAPAASVAVLPPTNEVSSGGEGKKNASSKEKLKAQL